MSTNLPAAPAAPDYAKANKEGIMTDIDTLPLRRQIEAASAGGTKLTYKDMVTGEEKTADFTGLGEADRAARAAKIMSDQSAAIQKDQLALRKEIGTGNAQQTTAELRAADPKAYAARMALGEKLTDEAFGKADYGKYVVDNPDLAKAYMAETGGSLTEGDAEGKIAAWGKTHYDKYGANEDRKLTRAGAPGDEIGLDTSAAGLAGLARERRARPDVGGVETDTSAAGLAGLARERRNRADVAGIDVNTTDASSADLNEGLQSAMAEFRKGGKLDDDTKRDLLNETRAGQAARGNFLGDAAAVVEATELGGAMEKRKAERLQNLLGVQNQVFGQNEALRGQNRANRAENAGIRGENEANWNRNMDRENLQNKQQVDENRATRNDNAGIRSENEANWNRNVDRENLQNKQQVDENRATRNENYARSQQKLANASSMILGNQLTNQWGGLAAAANGTVGAPTGVGYTPGIGQNANAGAAGNAAAQSNFGTLSNMWNTAANIAAQDNKQKIGAISGVAGAGLGAI